MPPEKGENLDRFEFRTEFPDWDEVNDPPELPHVGVKENPDDERNDYYKALILKDNGEYRWRAWQKGKERKMPYGPDLPPEITNMLIAYMNEAR